VYLLRFRRTLALTRAAGFAGTLIYTGNEVPMEPWIAAAEMARDYPGLSPFVAVNPVYMHPFTVARCIASLANGYGVRCDLNLVAGTSLSDLAALDEFDAHDDRYARLREFALVVRDLCGGRGPVSFDGRYFGARGLVLPSRIPDALQPGLVVAGQSAAADETARALGAESLGGLQPDLRPHAPRTRGVYMSVLCRATEGQAQAALAARYPDDQGRASPSRHGRNTDAVWKSAFAGMDNPAAQEVGPYRLGPFRRGQLDCALLVGSTPMVQDAIVRLAESGIERFVLDLPDAEADYAAVADAFAQAARVMAAGGAE
jgi:alkanesulfonate monooxygenase